MINTSDIVTIEVNNCPKEAAITDMKQEYKIVWEA